MKREKNILVVTHPLGLNIGGALQAFALQSFIKAKLGVKGGVYVSTASKKKRFRSYTRSSIVHSFSRKRIVVESRLVDSIVSGNVRRFIRSTVATLDTRNEPGLTLKPEWNIDTVIVGSDQVWRNAYGGALPYMMGDLEMGVPRLSYAASFGVGDLSEYSDGERVDARSLLEKFESLSVREDTGVGILEELGLSGVQHVDPTLLLDKSVYVSLIEDDLPNLCSSEGKIFTYILDPSVEKSGIVEFTEKVLNYDAFNIMPKRISSLMPLLFDRNSLKLPSITQWLKSFSDAEFIVTDSFHGCVFAIIFNKPFIAIANRERGMARFASLLKVFGLEDRLVASPEDMAEDLVLKDINWVLVNAKIKSEQKRSYDYLKKHLG